MTERQASILLWTSLLVAVALPLAGLATYQSAAWAEGSGKDASLAPFFIAGLTSWPGPTLLVVAAILRSVALPGSDGPARPLLDLAVAVAALGVAVPSAWLALQSMFARGAYATSSGSPHVALVVQGLYLLALAAIAAGAGVTAVWLPRRSHVLSAPRTLEVPSHG